MADLKGRASLMKAVEQGDIETVRALIEAGADVNAQDSRGWVSADVELYGLGMLNMYDL